MGRYLFVLFLNTKFLGTNSNSKLVKNPHHSKREKHLVNVDIAMHRESMSSYKLKLHYSILNKKRQISQLQTILVPLIFLSVLIYCMSKGTCLSCFQEKYCTAYY